MHTNKHTHTQYISQHPSIFFGFIQGWVAGAAVPDFPLPGHSPGPPALPAGSKAVPRPAERHSRCSVSWVVLCVSSWWDMPGTFKLYLTIIFSFTQARNSTHLNIDILRFIEFVSLIQSIWLILTVTRGGFHRSMLRLSSRLQFGRKSHSCSLFVRSSSRASGTTSFSSESCNAQFSTPCSQMSMLTVNITLQFKANT